MNRSNRSRSASYFFFASVALFSLVWPASAAVPEDKHWDLQFGPVGINDTAPSGITALGRNIYVGGNFLTVAGNTKANWIAGYNGTNWFPLNAGINPGSGGVALVLGLGTDGT